MVRVVLKPRQGIKVDSSNKYLFDPAISQAYDDLAKDWATKTDGLVESEDYSSKAYAIGGTGTETNNSKYYSEQAATSATNASTSETNAGISATTASTQAGIATNKANDASASATTATTQAGIAIAKAGEASTSATNAGISETNAGNSANSASASASLAHDWATSNTVVESGQYGARYYSLQAYNANVAAQAAKDLAKDWANKTDGTVDGVEYSAKYYAEQAAQQAIPSQTGHSGEYLTTDGSSMSWNAVDALPSQTGHSGEFLTTDGTDASWATVDALPDQTGQSGKFLTTDGTDASWTTVSVTVDQVYDSTSANAQSGVAIDGAKFIQNTAIGSGSISAGSNSSATGTNAVAFGFYAQAHANGALQIGQGQNTIANTFQVGSYRLLDTSTGIIPYQRINAITDSNAGGQLKTWTGTKAQYDAIVTKDANTLYNITDDTDVSLTILEALYPVGSIYITTAAACPLSTLIAGSTWVLVGQDRVLQGAGTRGVVGTTLNESLPNITGTYVIGCLTNGNPTTSGALYNYGSGATSQGQSGTSPAIGFDASRSSSTYQDNAPVQPDAYLVNIFERTN